MRMTCCGLFPLWGGRAQKNWQPPPLVHTRTSAVFSVFLLASLLLPYRPEPATSLSAQDPGFKRPYSVTNMPTPSLCAAKNA